MILTGFQFRAARRILNLTFTQLHKNTGILRGVLTRLENTISNLEEIKCSVQDAETLLNYFNQNKLIFPNKNTITLDIYLEPKPIEDNLTRFQFIVARTISGLSQRELAKSINFNNVSIYRFENKKNEDFLKSYVIEIKQLISFFKEKGISFPSNTSVLLE